MHFLSNVSSLECKKLVICDTNLDGVKVENLQAKLLEYASKTNGCMEVLTSGLIEAAAFPLAFVSLELLHLYIDHYDVKSKSIVSSDGTTILSISRETISSMLQLTTNTFPHSHPLKLWPNTVKLQANSRTPLLGNGSRIIMEAGLGSQRS